MLDHTEIKALIQQQGMLPLYFHEDPVVSVEVLRALYEAGIRVIEYTNRGNNALINFKKLKEESAVNYKDMCLGIGTIKSAGAAIAFINADADFLISPCWNDEILAVCNEKNCLWIPGCMTSTEIAKAEAKGITMVKLFPGSLLGPSYVSAIKDVFPDMEFMPTGGVSLDKKNLEEWFRSGVVSVGMGSRLISKDILALKEYNKITEVARKAIDMIAQIRSAMK
jgi:2-dehydro-3-deoxyphosphogluconate aldolase/(4S)-4-hydroxy-2-oxoglutarate aldolase